MIPAVAAVHLGGLKRGGSEDLQAMALVDDIDVEDSNTIGKDADYLLAQGVWRWRASLYSLFHQGHGKTMDNGMFLSLMSSQIMWCDQVCNPSHLIAF